MVTALDSGPGGPGSSPGQAHFAEFLGKIVYSISASLHLSVSIGTVKFTAGFASHSGWRRNTPSYLRMTAGLIGH